MTSHRFEARSTDELGDLIRWALQEVSEARPSSHAWGRIYVQIERRERFGCGLRWLFQVSASFVTFLITSFQSQGSWVEWRVDPRFPHFLIDQSGLFLLQLAS